MKAVKLALLTCHKHFQIKTIHFQIDNTTALSHLVKMWGGSGNQKQVFNGTNKRSLEVSPAPWDYNYCRISSRLHEHGGILVFQTFHKYFRKFVRWNENQRWIFLLLHCQLNFHGTMHENRIHTLRERMQCSKSSPISTFMLSHLFQWQTRF